MASSHEKGRRSASPDAVWLVDALRERISLWERYAAGDQTVEREFDRPDLAYEVFLHFGLLRRHARRGEERELVAGIGGQLQEASSLFGPATDYFLGTDLMPALHHYAGVFEQSIGRETLLEDEDVLQDLAIDLLHTRDELEVAFAELCRAVPDSHPMEHLMQARRALAEFDLHMRRRLDAFLVIADDVARVRRTMDPARIPRDRFWWWYEIEDYQSRLDEGELLEQVNPSGEQCVRPLEVSTDLEWAAVLYVEGSMSDAERDDYERHFARCHWCKERVEVARAAAANAEDGSTPESDGPRIIALRTYQPRRRELLASKTRLAAHTAGEQAFPFPVRWYPIGLSEVRLALPPQPRPSCVIMVMHVSEDRPSPALNGGRLTIHVGDAVHEFPIGDGITGVVPLEIMMSTTRATVSDQTGREYELGVEVDVPR